ncbi:MAG: redoxin domain-containing protein [Bacteroidota bacterium]|jgi:peroxiredoxin
MFKSPCIALLLALVFTGPAVQKTIAGNPSPAFTYKISGTVKGFTGQKLYLEKLNLQAVAVLDSATVNPKDKSFAFSGQVSEWSLLRVRIGASGNNGFLVAIDKPGNNIVFSGDSLTIPTFNYTVSGSVATNHIRDQISLAITTYNIINQLDMQLAGTTLAEKDRADMQKQRDELNASHLNRLYQFTDTVSSPISMIFCTVSLLSPTDHMDQWKKIDSRIKAGNYSFSLAQEFSDQIKAMELSGTEPSMPQGVSIGSEAPEISMADTSGRIITLSSLRGNYVLIDFWASWCGPCRMENPNVVQAYNRFRDKGFTIFSVSLDQDKGRWKKAILTDRLSWPYHTSELKGWNSAVCKDYGIHSIPDNYLIDPKGKIIASGLRGEDLTKTLEQYIK